MRIVNYLLWIAVIIVGVVFSQLNSVPVHFNYYVGTLDISLSLLLVLTFGLGGVLGVLASLNVIIQSKCRERRARLALKKHEQEHTHHLPIL